MNEINDRLLQTLDFFNKLTHFEQALLLNSFLQIDRDRLFELTTFFGIGEDHMLKLHSKVENHLMSVEQVWEDVRL